MLREVEVALSMRRTLVCVCVDDAELSPSLRYLLAPLHRLSARQPLSSAAPSELTEGILSALSP